MNQILCPELQKIKDDLFEKFQSPRSGKFESNLVSINGFHTVIDVFQSPRSGKFESNAMKARHAAGVAEMFQSPRSGKFESNSIC